MVASSKKFRKAILKPGRYVSPDGVVDVTPQRLKHWEKQFNRLRRNNQIVPIDWDHDDDPTNAVPLSINDFKKRSASNTVGKLENFSVKNGQAEILMDIHDPAAAAKAESNSVYVSPVIFSEWQDGRGRNYKDTITHVDFVNHPVDDSQSPFEPVESGAIACAIRMGLDMGKPKVYRMGDDDEMDYDNEDEMEGEEDFTDESVESDNDGPGEDDGGQYKTLAEEVMSRVGAEIPVDFDPMSDEGFVLLMTAVINALNANEEEMDEYEEEDMTEDVPEEGTEEMNAVPPEFAALSQRYDKQLKGMKQQMVAQEKMFTGRHRLSLMERLEHLSQTGRCTPSEMKRQMSLIKVQRLSVKANGTVGKTDPEKWIESREAIPENSVVDLQQHLRMASPTITAKDQPPHVSGKFDDISDEDAQKVIDDVFKKNRMFSSETTKV